MQGDQVRLDSAVNMNQIRDCGFELDLHIFVGGMSLVRDREGDGVVNYCKLAAKESASREGCCRRRGECQHG